MEPDKGAEKYMSLGQISNYKTALKCYEKGIEVFNKEIKASLNNQQLKTSLASAYATIAELYMNSNLW